MVNKADIVTLVKGETIKYVATHVEAVEGLETRLTDFQTAVDEAVANAMKPKIFSISPVSGFTNFNSDAKSGLKLILQGGLAHISGIVKNDSEIPASANTVQIADVSNLVTVTSTGSNIDSNSSANRHLSAVDGSGVLTISRPLVGASWAAIPANAWININVTFSATLK